jgi:hypothetical protein
MPRFVLPLLQDNYADINEPLHPLITLNLFEDTIGVIKIYELNKNIQHNGQKEKQRSRKYMHKTKDRLTRNPLKTGGELRCSGRVSISCSTSGTRCVNLITNPVINH